jgi:hypothetical protein
LVRDDDDEDIVEEWHTLVHVCQKWRYVVFGSPRRLDLRLLCEDRTPVKEILDTWPPLPIVISNYCIEKWGVDNIIAALEHNNRIFKVNLENISSSQFEKVLAVMQQPFPELTYLKLWSHDEVPVIPASFLGGSAPRLRTLYLESIPFPELPKLLLSATHPVSLSLWELSHSGFISPDAMVAALSASTRLESLVIRFESPYDYLRGEDPPDWNRRPPPPTRTLLPNLTKLELSGVEKYLEDLVARIDVPQLDNLEITFFHQLIFNTPQLTHFISRTPKFKSHDEARVFLSDGNWDVSITLPQTSNGSLRLGIVGECGHSDWQLSSLAQICSSSFPQNFIPAVEHLHILEHRFSQLSWLIYVESSEWLDFLHPFNAVKDLYITLKIMLHLAPILRELVGERVTEVLPALQTIFFKEPGLVLETIGPFITARQLAGYPISISRFV